MSIAWRLRGLKFRLTDTSLLFRHQARAAEDEFGEASQYWPDQRGHRFAREILEPKVHLMQPAMQAFAAQVRLSEAAALSGEAAEQAITAVGLAAQEVVTEAAAAARLSLSAEQLAGQAYGRSHTLAAESRRIDGALAALGNMPI